VDAVQGEALERFEEGGFRFRRGDESHWAMFAGRVRRCRGERGG
jgi:hypothetical protein